MALETGHTALQTLWSLNSVSKLSQRGSQNKGSEIRGRMSLLFKTNIIRKTAL